ncbi:hypothetical protein [Peterkaempfera bronchialis]|uniref:Uncharacterized protein n=1 Tax=Peterkaempfera bronchialis TaxID=2126346 RepID=A0A345SZR3_9ACTN|nr:hypothetical protein [Peterkaempfera bronchialis]AXI79218.1 hypothetical protein C7M71_019175 [Peterkaempfera bronchialis]
MTDPAALSHLTTLAFEKNKVTPGLLGFVVFAVLGAATWLLLKNMNRQFGKVDFIEEPEQPDDAAPRNPETTRSA